MPEVAKRATLLRASLTGRRPSQIPADDAGLAVGDLLRPGQPPGPALFADWRSTLLAFMGPGAGKTTALAIPLTVSAPGAVLATSNKPDLWAATAEIRASQGPVWLFDPLGICCQPQAFWIDFLGPLVSVETAHRLASHFVLTVEDPGKRELWGPAAQTLLTGLFLAAAVSGRTLHDPAMWLDQPAMPAPASLLDQAGYGKLASSLRGTQNGAPETRDGIYETARTAAKALRDEEVMRWITPQPGLPSFSPAAFPESRGTLYLLSEKASYATPLIAAASDLVIRAGLQRARELGGRLDPPVPLLFDEGANIAKIAELPDLYSYLGSHGLQPLTILQSYEQGVSVWGESGMAAMWGAATVKLIGAGVQSPRLARDVSTLVGQHDVAVRSITLGEARGVSEQISSAPAGDPGSGRGRGDRAGHRAAAGLRRQAGPGEAAELVQRAPQRRDQPADRPGHRPDHRRRDPASPRPAESGTTVTGPADPGTGARTRAASRKPPNRCTRASRTGSRTTSCGCSAGHSAGSSAGAPAGGAHPEAVSRLTAVWRAWEVCRLEPATGISDWYRDHLDHHLPILLGPRGPFFQCAPDTGHIDEPPFPTDPVDFTELDEAVAVTGEPDPGPGGPP